MDKKSGQTKKVDDKKRTKKVDRHFEEKKKKGKKKGKKWTGTLKKKRKKWTGTLQKKWTGTLKKGFNVVMDEIEPFDFFIEKKWFLDLRAKYTVFIRQINLIIFLNP